MGWLRHLQTYGAWARARDRTATSIVLTSSGDGEILVVTLKGTTSNEGPPKEPRPSLPGASPEGVFRLELWDLGPGGTVPEVTGPGTVTDATVRTTDRTPTFTAKAKGEQLSWSLDARDPTNTNVSGNQAGYTPEQPLGKGSHVLTVASLGPTWLTATAVVVQIRDASS